MGRSRKNRNRKKNKNKFKQMEKEICLVAIYDDLRRDCKNHREFLKDATYVGDFYSEPIYRFLKIHKDSALLLNGSTSVLFEVYQVTVSELDDIGGVLGCNILDNSKITKYDYFNKITIKTPYGEAYTFIYNENCVEIPEGSNKILSGDSRELERIVLTT